MDKPPEELVPQDVVESRQLHARERCLLYPVQDADERVGQDFGWERRCFDNRPHRLLERRNL